MGGFHLVDLLIIVGIALLLFGPKTAQSIARGVGRGVHQAKDVKEKVLAEFPLEEVAQISKAVAHIPLSPQQAARKLISATLMPGEQSGEEKTPDPKEEQDRFPNLTAEGQKKAELRHTWAQ